MIYTPEQLKELVLPILQSMPYDVTFNGGVKANVTVKPADVDRVADAIVEIIKQDREANYRHGYNDNARDCFCDKFPVKPHKHLMSDGESHNIRPEVQNEQAG